MESVAVERCVCVCVCVCAHVRVSYGLQVPPTPKSYVEGLTPNVMAFEGGAWEIIKFS